MRFRHEILTASDPIARTKPNQTSARQKLGALGPLRCQGQRVIAGGVLVEAVLPELAQTATALDAA